jgi:NADPH:quinone reductase-like Zn-dependent oxidoreductase
VIGPAALAPFRTSVTRAPLTRTTRSVKGHNISLTSGNPEKLETAVAFIRRGFGEGKLKPIIDRIFRFDEIVEAHRYLEANNQFGKIVATL